MAGKLPAQEQECVQEQGRGERWVEENSKKLLGCEGEGEIREPSESD